MKVAQYASLLLGMFCIITSYAGVPVTIPGPTPVIDMDVLTQTKNLFKQTQTLSDFIGDSTEKVNILQEQLQSLKQLTSGNFDDVSGNLNNLNNELSDIQNVTNNVNDISYTLQRIDDQYKKMFQPSNLSLSPQNYQNTYQQWSSQLQDASNKAMQSQALVQNIEDNNNQAKNILASAKDSNNNGEVSQLQTVNEMLGVINSQMGDVATMTATAGRLAASQASEQQAQADIQAQSLQNFVVAPPSYQNGEKYSTF